MIDHRDLPRYCWLQSVVLDLPCQRPSLRGMPLGRLFQYHRKIGGGGGGGGGRASCGPSWTTRISRGCKTFCVVLFSELGEENAMAN